MKVNVYLPKDIHKQAKEQELNLSGILRGALIEELNHIEALNKLGGRMKEYQLDLINDAGISYIGVITGKALNDNQTVFATDDDRLVVFFPEARKYVELDDPEELQEHLGDADYMAAMHTLGLKPRIAI